MPGRLTESNSGPFTRRAIQPMAQRLGLDFDRSFFTPPRSDVETALDAYRCGCALLLPYATENGWVHSDLGDDLGRTAKRLAKAAKRALVSDRGPDAISLMAQRYTHEMAQSWLRSVTQLDSKDQLRESAVSAEAVSSIAAACWPVDAQWIDQQISEGESERFFDPDNPDAMIDLHAYAGRARATAAGVGMLLGDEAHEALDQLIRRVLSLDMLFDLITSERWNLQAVHLVNLRRPTPLSYADVIQNQAAAVQ